MASGPATGETWRELLRPALRIIKEAERGYGRFDYRLGGGTVLMFRFRHRVSNDSTSSPTTPRR